MKVLLDTNIILDFFLEGEPFFDSASEVFEAITAESIEGFISASSATDIFYICRRQTQSIEEAREILTKTSFFPHPSCTIQTKKPKICSTGGKG